MLYFKKTGRPIIGSDSSDEDVISYLEDSDEGFGFINEGYLSKNNNCTLSSLFLINNIVFNAVTLIVGHITQTVVQIYCILKKLRNTK